MKTAAVRQVRSQSGKISAWLERGETVEIVKRGKAFARIEPARRGPGFVRACPAALPQDVDEPVNAAWDAAR